MQKIILTLVLVLILSGPAFASDTGAAATDISDACKLKIEKALREYDAYERQDSLIVPVSREEWMIMKNEMHDMHMRMKELHKSIQDRHGNMHQGPVPVPNRYNH